MFGASLKRANVRHQDAAAPQRSFVDATSNAKFESGGTYSTTAGICGWDGLVPERVALDLVV